MKKLFPLLTFVTFALSGLGNSAQAVTTANAFAVNVNLTAQCLVNTAAAPLNFGTYTAFSATAITATTAVSFKCTQGTTLTSVALDAASGAIAGLAYTLAVGPNTGALGTAGSATVAATADVATYTVTGTMAANQPGMGSGAGTATRTLTLTY